MDRSDQDRNIQQVLKTALHEGMKFTLGQVHVLLWIYSILWDNSKQGMGVTRPKEDQGSCKATIPKHCEGHAVLP